MTNILHTSNFIVGESNAEFLFDVYYEVDVIEGIPTRDILRGQVVTQLKVRAIEQNSEDISQFIKLI